MPAFRVVVNSSSVHGSIGYSTNLFPAMTLGCGAPGGNITSDNIGPQHLMNVKRIAWESRPVEHRTIPADQRMAGVGHVPEPLRQTLFSVPDTAKTTSAQQVGVPMMRKAAPQHTGKAEVPVLQDRATIARVVERVLSTQGIARGSGASKSATTPQALPSPSAVAAEVASRLFGTSPNPTARTGSTSAGTNSSSTGCAAVSTRSVGESRASAQGQCHNFPVCQRKRCAPRDDAERENFRWAKNNSYTLRARPWTGARSLCRNRGRIDPLIRVCRIRAVGTRTR